MELKLHSIYKNKNTGVQVSLEKVEIVKNTPENISVCVLSDNTRWENSQFIANHVLASQKAG